MPKAVETIDVVGCARCWGDGHKQLEFHRLTHPLVINDVELSHWAPCPTNGEPILLAFVEKPAEEDDGTGT
jgi:hypothetical protein